MMFGGKGVGVGRGLMGLGREPSDIHAARRMSCLELAIILPLNFGRTGDVFAHVYVCVYVSMCLSVSTTMTVEGFDVACRFSVTVSKFSFK